MAQAQAADRFVVERDELWRVEQPTKPAKDADRLPPVIGG